MEGANRHIETKAAVPSVLGSGQFDALLDRLEEAREATSRQASLPTRKADAIFGSIPQQERDGDEKLNPSNWFDRANFLIDEIFRNLARIDENISRF